jgi:hypothetical protein
LNIGFYYQRKVTLELKLVDGTTGGPLWENTKTAAFRNLVLDKEQAKQQFVDGLVSKMVDNVLKSPLEEEARMAARQVLATLPGFQFGGFAEDDSAGAQLRRVSKTVIKESLKKK